MRFMLRCTESSSKVSTMGEQELKARLERALHTRISAAEWLDITDQGYVRECVDGVISWREFREIVDEALSRLSRFLQNTQREQSGEPLLKAKIREKAPEPTGVTDVPVS